jgi:hypothetical protein
VSAIGLLVPTAPKASAEAARWTVVYHHQAVVEFEALRDKRQRKGVLTIVSILRQIGPKIVEPHAKPVQGTNGLWELRPGGGKVIVRPLYARVDAREYVILAIGPDAVVDASGFKGAVKRARARAKGDYGLEL